MKTPDLDSDRRLTIVIKAASSFGLAVMAAFLVSIEAVSPDLKFRFSWWAPPVFALTLALSRLFWRVVFRENESPSGTGGRKRRRILFTILSCAFFLATVTAFGISLKGIGNERIREVIEGAAIAVLALGSVGILIWQIARFLERDNRNTSPTEKQPPEP